ncbi:hypothetical protein ON010_g14051 [Phytophthora cinnamomi]|nr:hypothetical protein ON010_g14051 [Phytophthora cinnamomi]
MILALISEAASEREQLEARADSSCGAAEIESRVAHSLQLRPLFSELRAIMHQRGPLIQSIITCRGSIRTRRDQAETSSQRRQVPTEVVFGPGGPPEEEHLAGSSVSTRLAGRQRTIDA